MLWLDADPRPRRRGGDEWFGHLTLPDLCAPDFGAPRFDGHLILAGRPDHSAGRSICSARAKAAEGASPRTLEWYRMILRPRRPPVRRGAAGRRRSSRPSCGPGCSSSGRPSRRVASPATSGPSRPSATGALPRSSPQAAALPGAPPAEGPAPAHRALLRRRAAAPPRPRRRPRAGARSCSCSTPGSGCPSWPRCGSATSGPTARSMSWARAPRSGSCRSARPPGRALVRYLGSPVPAQPDDAALPRSPGRARRPAGSSRRSPASGPGRGRPALQPAHAPPHLRPELPRQRRRRVQPPADPRPHDARHGQALRGAVRRRPRRPPSSRLAGGSAHGREEAVAHRWGSIVKAENKNPPSSGESDTEQRREIGALCSSRSVRRTALGNGLGRCAPGPQRRIVRRLALESDDTSFL